MARRLAPSDRAALRRSMQRLRMGELRDGVWLRPDNLPADRLPEDRAVVDAFTRWFTVHPDDDGDLAGLLWDLPAWEARAMDLRRAMAALLGRLVDGDTDSLAPGFVVSAAVLRHFNADPLLPRELLGRRWPGDALRADYERYDAAYKALLADWLGVGRRRRDGGDRDGRDRDGAAPDAGDRTAADRT
jgi:phenylacetic acid degradation operon negative regulatory protein